MKKKKVVVMFFGVILVVLCVFKIFVVKIYVMGCGLFVIIIYMNKYYVIVVSIKIFVFKKFFFFNFKLKYGGFLSFGILNFVR